MEGDEILDGKCSEIKTKKIKELISDTSDKLLEIATDRREFPSRLDIELLLKQFARDFGNLLLFGESSEQSKE